MNVNESTRWVCLISLLFQIKRECLSIKLAISRTVDSLSGNTPKGNKQHSTKVSVYFGW